MDKVKLRVLPGGKPEKKTQTVVDTWEMSVTDINSWVVPPFQRLLRVNDKVKSCSTKIKEDGGVVPGIITLGVVGKDATRWLLDGQHRREAARLSGCTVFYADVRLAFFETMADMGQEFVDLNSHLVNMRPDDVLRGLEASSLALTKLRAECRFVGYDQVRRGTNSSVMLSMSAALRCWRGSAADVPAGSVGSAANLGAELAVDEAETLISFLHLAHKAWSNDYEYRILWKALNLTLCMWLYRRTVIQPYSAKTPKLTRDQYGKCITALSANAAYMDYLAGRQLTDRDRAPAYDRLKRAFAKRLEEDFHKKATLPAPPWAHGSSNQAKR